MQQIWHVCSELLSLQYVHVLQSNHVARVNKLYMHSAWAGMQFKLYTRLESYQLELIVVIIITVVTMRARDLWCMQGSIQVLKYYVITPSRAMLLVYNPNS